jgi:4-carboxymuconolactone decarboxylase
MSGNEQRIPAAGPSEERQELLARVLVDGQGRPLKIFTVLAHHPLLLRRAAALGAVFLGEGTTLPARERELVILRVASRVASGYELAQHTVIGRALGLTEDELARVTESELVQWSDGDRALLCFTDQLLAGDDVSDEAWEPVAERFREPQLIELILLVGYYRMLAGFLRSARIPVEDTVDVSGTDGLLAP